MLIELIIPMKSKLIAVFAAVLLCIQFPTAIGDSDTSDTIKEINSRDLIVCLKTSPERDWPICFDDFDNLSAERLKKIAEGSAIASGAENRPRPFLSNFIPWIPTPTEFARDHYIR